MNTTELIRHVGVGCGGCAICDSINAILEEIGRVDKIDNDFIKIIETNLLKYVIRKDCNDAVKML